MEEPRIRWDSIKHRMGDPLGDMFAKAEDALVERVAQRVLELLAKTGRKE